MDPGIVMSTLNRQGPHTTILVSKLPWRHLSWRLLPPLQCIKHHLLLDLIHELIIRGTSQNNQPASLPTTFHTTGPDHLRRRNRIPEHITYTKCTFCKLTISQIPPMPIHQQPDIIDARHTHDSRRLLP